jgi:hypothetical protein
VSISGVPWRVGQHCLYNAGAGGATFLGAITNMFHGEDALNDDLVIFQVQKIPITTFMGHYCLFSNDAHTTVDMVLWKQVTWKCKTFKMEHANMALPYVSCTSRELVELR